MGGLKNDLLSKLDRMHFAVYSELLTEHHPHAQH